MTSDMTPVPSASRPRKKTRPTHLQWFAWEKLTIWGLFLLAVYTLRSFFFIIFMTFIISYIMRGLVVRVTRVLSPRTERAWLERSLTLVFFALALFGLYGVGSYLGPPLRAQTEALWGRAANFDVRREFDRLLTRTVGVFLQERQYGDREAEAYKEEFREFTNKGPRKVSAYRDFPAIRDQIEGAFEANFRQREKERLEKQYGDVTDDEEFRDWFLATKAPGIYEKDKKFYIDRWEEAYLRAGNDEAELEQRKLEPEFEKERDRIILTNIFRDVKDSPDLLGNLVAEWKKTKLDAVVGQKKQTPEYKDSFREYYQTMQKVNAAGFPYEFEKYVELRDAYRKGEVAFTRALGVGTEELSDEELLEQQHREFELAKQEELAKQWWKGEGEAGAFATQLRSTLSSYAETAGKTVATWIPEALTFVVTIPIQLALSLLLSFFITFDMPKLRRGVRKLQQSRVRDFYLEIAPGLYSFGQLIGRAFQAQGVIALFNTLLTFMLITFLSIQNELFLCAIVFLCSFIPVLGVVLSSIPIAVMALVQPGGSLLVSVYAIVGILIIHFIETSVLNPKILGDMLHLHPVMVLAILAVGEHFFGVWGLLLGVPVMVYIIRFVILDEGIPGLISRMKPVEDSSALAVAGPAARELPGAPPQPPPSETSGADVTPETATPTGEAGKVAEPDDGEKAAEPDDVKKPRGGARKAESEVRS